MFFSATNHHYSVLKFFKYVDRQSAEQFKSKQCLKNCLNFFHKRINEYPNSFNLNFEIKKYKSLDKFNEEIKKLKNEDLVFMSLWEKSTKSFISINNGILYSDNREDYYIDIILGIKDVKLNADDIQIFAKNLFESIEFDYGYFLKAPKNYDFLYERRMRKTFFGGLSAKVTRRDISINEQLIDVYKGYYRNIYPLNFLNSSHLESEEIQLCIRNDQYVLKKLNDKIYTLYSSNVF